jgi:hypothetical protein
MIASLNELWLTGRLIAEHPVAQREISDLELQQWIVAAEVQYRNQLPNCPPPVDTNWAVWAVRQFMRAAQLLVHRELGEEFIRSGLESEPVESVLTFHQASAGQQASIHYSVDLVFRFLPDLERLAKAASPADPLLDQLRDWGQRWPLSGARMQTAHELKEGNSVTEDERLEPIFMDRCLRILYIERLLGPNPTAD